MRWQCLPLWSKVYNECWIPWLRLITNGLIVLVRSTYVAGRVLNFRGAVWMDKPDFFPNEVIMKRSPHVFKWAWPNLLLSFIQAELETISKMWMGYWGYSVLLLSFLVILLFSSKWLATAYPWEAPFHKVVELVCSRLLHVTKGTCSIPRVHICTLT